MVVAACIVWGCFHSYRLFTNGSSTPRVASDTFNSGCWYISSDSTSHHHPLLMKTADKQCFWEIATSQWTLDVPLFSRTHTRDWISHSPQEVMQGTSPLLSTCKGQHSLSISTHSPLGRAYFIATTCVAMVTQSCTSSFLFALLILFHLLLSHFVLPWISVLQKC